MTTKKKPAKRKGQGQKKTGKRKASPKIEVLPELPEAEEPERKKGGAPIGNKFWMARSSHGRNPIFKNPEQLWTACLEYFEWVEANPLLEEKGFAFQGVVTHEVFPKMRAMTIGGLCIFLDIVEETWRNYRADDDFLGVITKVEQIIRYQKFTGAAADQLNANIIARDLGLRDSMEHTGANGGPIKTSNVTVEMSPKEAAQAYKDFARGG
jgi:hypothetical protein